MKFIRTISTALSWIERSLLVTMLGVMVLLAFSQVILRNFFSSGFLWADPLLRHMVLWMGFLGASLATQQEKHINIDIITRFLKPRLVIIVRILTNIFAGIVCYALANAGWTFVRSEMATDELLLTIGNQGFPAWWFQIIIPVGFGIMAFRFSLKAVEHIIESMQPTLHVPPSTNIPTIDA